MTSFVIASKPLLLEAKDHNECLFSNVPVTVQAGLADTSVFMVKPQISLDHLFILTGDC